MIKDKTVIISCAGMGTRLGIGEPKALLDIEGKPLIVRQLEQLDSIEDVCIVVGYKAEEVICVARKYRDDVRIVYNNDYRTTGTAASFSQGLAYARKWSVALDGDLLVHPEDLKSFLAQDIECIGGCLPTTDNPVLMELDEHHCVKEFSREHGQLEWTGLAMMKTSHLTNGRGHVYQMLEPLIPIKVIEIRTKEIDTMNDYQNALKWIRNGYTN